MVKGGDEELQRACRGSAPEAEVLLEAAAHPPVPARSSVSGEMQPFPGPFLRWPLAIHSHADSTGL